MPYPHSEAIHWYYRVFMPAMQHSRLLPNKPEDWARLQVWDGNSLKTAMPAGFSGVPTEEQINQLYAHVQNRELFFFELGQQTPVLWLEDKRLVAAKEPAVPAKPKLVENPTSDKQRKANETAIKTYDNEVGNYQELLNVNQKYGAAFWSAVEGYYAGRNLEQDRKEAASRNNNAELQEYQYMRARADRVISEMMAPRPNAPADIFYKSQQHMDGAVIHYRHYDNDLKPNGYELPANDKLNDRDAATINFAMLFVSSHMGQFLYDQGKGGTVHAETSAESGVSMMLTGLFGKARPSQPLNECLGEAMKLGKEVITAYLDNNPEMLGRALAESVQKIKKHLVGTGIKTLTQDTVAGTKIIERLLELFEKNPDIWQATGMSEQDRDFMRGYVQMGKVYDQFAQSQMKYVAAQTEGTALSREEKAEILVDTLLRRMVEKELAKDEKLVSENAAYLAKQMDAVQKDMEANAKLAQWEAANVRLKEEDPDAYGKASNRERHMLNVSDHMTYAAFETVEHPIINQLGQPGMLERMRQILLQDPFILAQANKSPLEFTSKELAATEKQYEGKMDALIDQIQPSVGKAVWFGNLQSMLAADGGRLVIPQLKGKNPLVSVESLLKGGLQALQNPDYNTLSMLYEHAKNGNLYFYGEEKDMPVRLTADGAQLSAQTLQQPAKPSRWMRFANFITFGLAYAEECRAADTYDLFVKESQARGAAAQIVEAEPQPDAANEQPQNENEQPQVAPAPEPVVVKDEKKLLNNYNEQGVNASFARMAFTDNTVPENQLGINGKQFGNLVAMALGSPELSIAVGTRANRQYNNPEVNYPKILDHYVQHEQFGERGRSVGFLRNAQREVLKGMEAAKKGDYSALGKIIAHGLIQNNKVLLGQKQLDDRFTFYATLGGRALDLINGNEQLKQAVLEHLDNDTKQLDIANAARNISNLRTEIMPRYQEMLSQFGQTRDIVRKDKDGKEYKDKDFLVVGNKRNVAKVCQLFRIDYQMRTGELNLETTEYVKDDTAEKLTEQLNKGRVLDNFLVEEKRVDILQDPVAMNRLYSQALKEYQQKFAPQAKQPELEKNIENQPKEQSIGAQLN